MKVVVAIDSMKGSLSSLQAGTAVRTGILRVFPDTEVVIRPLADGGEGTVDALAEGMGAELRTVSVTGPLGDPVDATYAILRESGTAVIEMASAAGITLISHAARDPMRTTTYGVGELIRDAVQNGCRHFLIGIGGSATNDGGVGMLQALGFELLDEAGHPVPGGAAGLDVLTRIGFAHVMPELAECTFRVACDVENPLCGPDGASSIYGPQKGASPEMVVHMDTAMARYAELAGAALGKRTGDSAEALAETPGAGAAGGLGYALLAFLHARLEPGIRIVLEETGLEQELPDADFVVTGEGRLDHQTAMGKAPAGVAALAKRYHRPVIAFAGTVTKGAAACNTCGIDAFFPILRGIMTLEEALVPETAADNLAATAEQVFRLIRAVDGRQ